MLAPVTASVAEESRRLSQEQRCPGHCPPPIHWHRAGSGVGGLDGDLEVIMRGSCHVGGGLGQVGAARSEAGAEGLGWGGGLPGHAQLWSQGRVQLWSVLGLSVWWRMGGSDNICTAWASHWQGMLEQVPWVQSCHMPLCPVGKRIQ